jgi:hypothetical protein
VTDGVSGVFFDEQTNDSLAAAIEQCHGRSWDPLQIRASVERFSIPIFIQQLSLSIEACLAGDGQRQGNTP